MANSVDVIGLTRQLVALNTINPPGNEDACARLVGSLLLDAGFEVAYHEFAPSRTSVVARRGRHCGGSPDQVAKPICLTGHLDTVPLGTASWSVDPFAGDIVEGKLFGRGTTDMKAGNAAMVAAALDSAARRSSRSWKTSASTGRPMRFSAGRRSMSGACTAG